jgi:hypothetical protein
LGHSKVIHHGFGGAVLFVDKAFKSVYCVGVWMESAGYFSLARSKTVPNFGLIAHVVWGQKHAVMKGIACWCSE